MMSPIAVIGPWPRFAMSMLWTIVAVQKCLRESYLPVVALITRIVLRMACNSGGCIKRRHEAHDLFWSSKDSLCWGNGGGNIGPSLVQYGSVESGGLTRTAGLGQAFDAYH